MNTTCLLCSMTEWKMALLRHMCANCDSWKYPTILAPGSIDRKFYWNEVNLLAEKYPAFFRGDTPSRIAGLFKRGVVLSLGSEDEDLKGILPPASTVAVAAMHDEKYLPYLLQCANLKKLEVGVRIKAPLNLRCFWNLTTLRLTHLHAPYGPGDDNRDYEGRITFTDTLGSIHLGYRYNRRIPPLPNLRILSLGGDYNRTLPDFPKLESLRLGRAFSKELTPSVTLTELVICGSNVASDFSAFPNLRVLKYGFPVTGAVNPRGIRRVKALDVFGRLSAEFDIRTRVRSLKLFGLGWNTGSFRHLRRLDIILEERSAGRFQLGDFPKLKYFRIGGLYHDLDLDFTGSRVRELHFDNGYHGHDISPLSGTLHTLNMAAVCQPIDLSTFELRYLEFGLAKKQFILGAQPKMRFIRGVIEKHKDTIGFALDLRGFTGLKIARVNPRNVRFYDPAHWDRLEIICGKVLGDAFPFGRITYDEWIVTGHTAEC